MTEFRNKHLVVLMVAFCQVVITISLSMLFVPVPRDNTIFPGVFINGINVSGMSREEAISKVAGNVDSDITEEIVFRDGKRKWTYSLKELGYDVNVSQAVNAAIGMTQKYSALGKVMELMKIKRQKRNITVQTVVDRKKLNEAINQLAAAIEEKATDAKIEFNDGQFKLISEREGRIIDIEETEKRINNTLDRTVDNFVIIPVKNTSPHVKVDDLKDMKNLIGFGVTIFDRGDKSWTDDMMHVIKAIDGTVIQPGQEFSFEERTWGKGDKARIDGQSTEDNMTQVRLKSNGYSQVASTLYQAVIYAGFEVEKRIPHYIVPTYASAGFDAVIVTGKSDLQFRNTSESPVYINALIRENKVIINLLGVKSGKGTFQISSTSKKDGENYIITDLYRVRYNKGVEVKREVISEDRYTLVP